MSIARPTRVAALATVLASALGGGLLVATPATAADDTTPPFYGLPYFDPAVDAKGWVHAGAKLVVSGGDASGINRAEYRFNDQGDWASIRTPNQFDGYEIPLTLEGQYKINYRLVDNAGNTAPETWMPVKYDAGAPIITVTGATNGGTLTLGSGATLGASCVDAGAGLRSCDIQFDNVAVQPGAALDHVLGAHTITVAATDNLDKAATTTISYTVIPKPEVIIPVDTGNNGPLNPNQVVKVSSSLTAKFSSSKRTMSLTVAEKALQSGKGKATVVIKKGKKTIKTIKTSVSSKNKASVTLPKLKKGTYSVTVKYAGNTWIKASTKKFTLKITK